MTRPPSSCWLCPRPAAGGTNPFDDASLPLPKDGRPLAPGDEPLVVGGNHLKHDPFSLFPSCSFLVESTRLTDPTCTAPCSALQRWTSTANGIRDAEPMLSVRSTYCTSNAQCGMAPIDRALAGREAQRAGTQPLLPLSAGQRPAELERGRWGYPCVVGRTEVHRIWRDKLLDQGIAHLVVVLFLFCFSLDPIFVSMGHSHGHGYGTTV